MSYCLTAISASNPPLKYLLQQTIIFCYSRLVKGKVITVLN